MFKYKLVAEIWLKSAENLIYLGFSYIFSRIRVVFQIHFGSLHHRNFDFHDVKRSSHNLGKHCSF